MDDSYDRSTELNEMNHSRVYKHCCILLLPDAMNDDVDAGACAHDAGWCLPC